MPGGEWNFFSNTVMKLNIIAIVLFDQFNLRSASFEESNLRFEEGKGRDGDIGILISN